MLSRTRSKTAFGAVRLDGQHAFRQCIDPAKSVRSKSVAHVAHPSFLYLFGIIFNDGMDGGLWIGAGGDIGCVGMCDGGGVDEGLGHVGVKLATGFRESGGVGMVTGVAIGGGAWVSNGVAGASGGWAHSVRDLVVVAVEDFPTRRRGPLGPRFSRASGGGGGLGTFT